MLYQLSHGTLQQESVQTSTCSRLNEVAGVEMDLDEARVG